MVMFVLDLLATELCLTELLVVAVTREAAYLLSYIVCQVSSWKSLLLRILRFFARRILEVWGKGHLYVDISTEKSKMLLMEITGLSLVRRVSGSRAHILIELSQSNPSIIFFESIITKHYHSS